MEHILSAINVIQTYKDQYTFDEAKANPIIFYGFVKHIEIIGEAVYMLTKDFREMHPEVEWEAIEGMRHVLVHGYYNIRPEQVWQVIEEDVPALKPQIEAILKSL